MIRYVLFPLLAGLLAAGCATTYKEPKIDSKKGDDRVYGIEEVLAREEVTEVDVLMIHGMCTHGRGWVRQSFNNLGKKMGFINEELDLAKVKRRDLVPRARIGPTGRMIAGSGTKASTVEEKEHTALYSYKFEKDGKSLWVHAILWSPSTEPLKKKLCYDITDRDSADGKKCRDTQAYIYKRAKYNAKYKDKLMNNCLADVFIYLGEKQKEIQKQVAMAIIYAAGVRSADHASWEPIIERAREETAPIFIIAESMGCKVIFDTLAAMFVESIGRGDLIDEILLPHSEPQKKGQGLEKARLVEAVENTLRRTEQVYMGGNQIPVLSLANESKFRELVDKTRIVDHPLPLAVFSDPNDIFSYTLGYSGFDDISGIRAVDVIVSNGRTWFGRFESPISAHEGYRDNPQVDKIIRCGYPTWTGCREQ